MTLSPSLEQLEERAGNPTHLISLKLAFIGKNYSDWLALIDEAVPAALRILAENPELHHEHTEDQLTILVISMLTAMGFQASHESKVGGHCDVNIRAKFGWLWLGEAKKFENDYGWLLKGYQQLFSRYTTGEVNQDHGGLIIYSIVARIDRTMIRWREKLLNEGICQCEDVDAASLSFISTQEHDRTGRPFNVKHYPVSLYFAPKA